jgi:uncharacterized protein YuzE
MAVDIRDIRRIVGEPVEIPPVVDSHYDREADVLYVTFERGIEDDSVFSPDNVVLRYLHGRLLSITILNASKRSGLHLDPQ